MGEATVVEGRRVSVQPRHLVIALAVYLGGAYALVVGVDVLNVAGARDFLANSALSHRPAVWFWLFHEGGPTEWLQWFALGATTVVAAFIAGRLHATGTTAEARGLATCWLLLAVAMALFVIEDAGNVRHAIRGYIVTVRGGGAPEKAFELAYYAVLAGLPLYAIARYWRPLARRGAVAGYLAAAVVFYGIAGSTSAFRHWGEWYERTGAMIMASIGDGMLEIDPGPVGHSTAFWLMDTLFEETVELIGAAMFLCAAVAFYHAALGAATPRHRPEPTPARTADTTSHERT